MFVLKRAKINDEEAMNVRFLRKSFTSVPEMLLKLFQFLVRRTLIEKQLF